MQLSIFHLEARSAFHFGVRGVGIEQSSDHAPSDTVFGALCNIIRIGESLADLETMLKQFTQRTPPFLCSGAFPYVMLSEAPLRFYPAPLNLRHSEEKSLRRIRWLSETLFSRWIGGQLDEASLEQAGETLPGGVYVTTNELEMLLRQYEGNELCIPSAGGDAAGQLYLWQIDEVPRVAVDRRTSASNIFQAGRLHFPAGGGLWCAFQLNSGWTIDRLSNLMAQLGDVGLGGERSSGYGQFTVHLDTTGDIFTSAAQTRRFITLSHYRPEPDEIGVLGADSAYDLTLRRGWMSSPDRRSLRHRSVRMIAAGSVLHTTNTGSPYGGLVDVTPQRFRDAGGHNVWRYGFALPLGVSD